MVISDFYRVVGERLSPKGDIEEEGVLTQEEFAAHMMENPADFLLWCVVEQTVPQGSGGGAQSANGYEYQLV